MSYGKLTVRMRVHDIDRDGLRWATLLTRHTISQEEATEHARKWIRLNLSRDQLLRINIVWQADPVLIPINKE